MAIAESGRIAAAQKKRTAIIRELATEPQEGRRAWEAPQSAGGHSRCQALDELISKALIIPRRRSGRPREIIV
jgi:hypothetical protein